MGAKDGKNTKKSNFMDLDIKQEPIDETEQINLINEKDFDENLNENELPIQKQLIAKKIWGHVTSIDKKLFHLNCLQCCKEYLLSEWLDFCKHITSDHPEIIEKPTTTTTTKRKAKEKFSKLTAESEESNLNRIYAVKEEPEPNDEFELASVSLEPQILIKTKEKPDFETIKLQNALKRSRSSLCKSKKSNVPLNKKPSNQSNDAEQNLSEDNDNCNVNSKDLDDEAHENESNDSEPCPEDGNDKKQIESSDTNELNIRGEAEPPKKRKKDEEIIFFNDSSNKLITSFLEMIKENPMLWHGRHMSRNLFDDTLSKCLPKFNEKHKIAYTENNVTLSIKRMKLAVKRSSFDRKFGRYRKLWNEIEEAADRMMFKCTDCSRSFFKAIDLQVHKVKTHNIGELPFKCRECDYSSADRSKVDEHEKRHNQVYTCEICQKVCYYKYSLKAHMASHSGIVCEVCGQKFDCQRKYYRHKIKHTTPTEKCDMCDKAYYDKWTLAEHKKSHYNEREYVCEECSKAYNTRRALGIHMKNVHQMKLPYEPGNRYVWVTCKAGDDDDDGDHEQDDDYDDMSDLSSNSSDDPTKSNKKNAELVENKDSEQTKPNTNTAAVGGSGDDGDVDNVDAATAKTKDNAHGTPASSSSSNPETKLLSSTLSKNPKLPADYSMLPPQLLYTMFNYD